MKLQYNKCEQYPETVKSPGSYSNHKFLPHGHLSYIHQFYAHDALCNDIFPQQPEVLVCGLNICLTFPWKRSCLSQILLSFLASPPNAFNSKTQTAIQSM